MLNFLLIIYCIVLSLLTFVFCHIIKYNKMKQDLVFFCISNYILSFSFLVFFFHFNDYLFSFFNVILLLINTIFLNHEIKITKDKYKYYSIPYLLYIVFIAFLIFDLILVNL